MQLAARKGARIRLDSYVLHSLQGLILSGWRFANMNIFDGDPKTGKGFLGWIALGSLAALGALLIGTLVPTIIPRRPTEYRLYRFLGRVVFARNFLPTLLTA